MATITRHAEYRFTTRTAGSFHISRDQALSLLAQVPNNYSGTIIIARFRQMVYDEETGSNGHLLCGICRQGNVTTIYLRRIGQTNQMPTVWERGQVRSANYLS